MAKLTKSQARRRANEIYSKAVQLTFTAGEYGSVMTTSDFMKIEAIVKKVKNKMK